MKKSNKGRLTSEEIQSLLDKSIIKPHAIDGELEQSFLDYAMSVIVSRAIPDAKDGFKPVHRRVLYGAQLLGMTHDKPYKKSARLVGEVMGKFHPHGDSAIYQTMVRMAQDFSMRYTLIDGHGNFGSIDGDAAAAMRYTEARLSKISAEMLRNIDKNTVDFIENYDGSELEPQVLPAGFPNLLANGTNGIAVGMATNMPPHNLTEICDALLHLAKNNEATINELMEFIKGPDFPTAAEIVGEKGIASYFHTGRGSVIMRSKYDIEEESNGKQSIIVTEIPYQVNKTALIEKIVELVKTEAVEGITDLRDESSREGIRIVIELRRDIIPEVLLNKLFKMTSLQTSFAVNNLALVNGVPKILNIKELLLIYIEHQIDVLLRKTKFELNKAEERAHILEGLTIATHNIDRIIEIIKNAPNNDEAMKSLISEFKLSEIQSKAILDMRLRNLSGLEREKLEQELGQLRISIDDMKDIINSNERQINEVCTQIETIKTKFGDERRTEILYGVSADIDDEDLIPVEDIVVTMSKRGYLKRLPIDTYRTQKRGGVGVQGVKTHEDDDVEKIVVTNTHTDLLIFSNLGKVYRIRGHEIPYGSRQSKGIPAQNIIDLEKHEKIFEILTVEDYNEKKLFFVTKNGTVKRVNIELFNSIHKNGKKAITLNEGDEIFSVHLTKGNSELFIAGNGGKCVRFNENDIRVMGRTASGVRGIKLPEKGYVVGSGTTDDGTYVLSIGEKGYGKLTETSEYRLSKRGAQGVTTLKVNDKTGKLAVMKIVTGTEHALLITSLGKIIRIDLQTVSKISRSTSGVKLMNIPSGEKIKSIALFNDNDEGVNEEVVNEGSESVTNDSIESNTTTPVLTDNDSE